MRKISVLFIAILLLILTACDSTENISENTSAIENQSVETITETVEPEEQLVTYYDRDDTINLYLNRFNSANPAQIINSDLFRVYYHHGSEHDDQIIFNRDDVEVVITGNGFSNSIKLVIDGSRDKTSEDYKLLFFQYAKAFSIELTDEKLETYWQAILDDIINSAEFEEFDCSLTTSYDDKIEYMVIEGKIS